jgi:radical SAM superfamily enzyme YgiQ (UPF0313 family)
VLKIRLIVPKWPPPGPFVPPFPPLSLAILAAYTPSEFDVDIVDENIEQINFDDKVDMVGITAFTHQAKRAYEIADEYRKRNVTVVMGGVHASSVPDEALEHADSVVIGEAEGVWTKVIEDFKMGKLQKTYKASTYIDLAKIRLPRWDLIKRNAYIYRNVVQTTRGCPKNCTFCSVPYFYGKKIRHKPIKHVVKEIRQMLKGLKGIDRFVYFLDDNTGLPPSYGKALFKALIPLKIYWMGETSIEIARDEELLRLAAESGCVCLMLGFESLSTKNLDQLQKNFIKPSMYEEAVRKLHEHGIAVYGFFIVGLDDDDESVFEETVEWAQKNAVDFASFAPLVHFPKTQAYEKDKDRLVNEKWWLVEPYQIDYYPKSISREKLQKGLLWMVRKYFSDEYINERVKKSPKTMKPLLPLALAIQKGIYYYLKYAKINE